MPLPHCLRRWLRLRPQLLHLQLPLFYSDSDAKTAWPPSIFIVPPPPAHGAKPRVFLFNLFDIQPFFQNSRKPTVAKEFQIGLYDPAEADLELFSLAFRTGCSQSVVMHTYTSIKRLALRFRGGSLYSCSQGSEGVSVLQGSR